ncbi:MAG: rod-binding protein [Planctomycetota bacterium]
MDGAIERTAAVSGDLLAGRVSRLQRASGDSKPDVAAREMEALFATLLVAEMRKGLGEGFFGSGPGADTFAGWFDEELGGAIAANGAIGVGEQVREAMLRQQAAEKEAGE